MWRQIYWHSLVMFSFSHWQVLIVIQSEFVEVYTNLVIGETLLLLLMAFLLTRFFSRHPSSFLSRKVQPARPIRALAVLTLFAGLSLFAFWAVLDVLSGYNAFPASALRAHPLAASIYNDFGLSYLPLPDKDRLLGVIAFCVAEVSFILLRAERGIGVAVRDGILFFAAPIIAVFELALWYYVPAEMYWRVTALTSWSIGRYANSVQFSAVTDSPALFSWAGNIYLLSNWFVLLAASCLFAFGVLKFLAPTNPDAE